MRNEIKDEFRMVIVKEKEKGLIRGGPQSQMVILFIFTAFIIHAVFS